jgi:putative hemolysin
VDLTERIAATTEMLMQAAREAGKYPALEEDVRIFAELLARLGTSLGMLHVVRSHRHRGVLDAP